MKYLRGGGILLISAAMLLALFSCGKKGPPFLPTMKTPVTVKLFKGEWEDGIVALKGKAVSPKGNRRSLRSIKGCMVYHAWHPLDNPPCGGCPIKFSGFYKTDGEVITGQNFLCRVPGIRQKGIHFFKVRLIDRNDILGPPSNRLKLIVND